VRPLENLVSNEVAYVVTFGTLMDSWGVAIGRCIPTRIGLVRAEDADQVTSAEVFQRHLLAIFIEEPRNVVWGAVFHTDHH